MVQITQRLNLLLHNTSQVSTSDEKHPTMVTVLGKIN
jgi:hypothetical protein